MEEKILQLAASQGIWAILSVCLIFYILKKQEKRDSNQEMRETKYQEIITNLTDKLDLVEDVKKDVEDIKDYFLNKNLKA